MDRFLRIIVLTLLLIVPYIVIFKAIADITQHYENELRKYQND